MAVKPPLSASGKPALEVARACAAAARDIMRTGFGEATITSTKGRGNVLTATDLAVEAAVQQILQREYPQHALMSEESAAAIRSEGWMWVVDPLDGTKNFSRGIPQFCFTIALCHASEPVVALTLEPLLDEEFAAVAGKGCTLNGQPVLVSAVARVQDAVFAMDMGYDDARARRQLEMALRLWPGMQSLRVPGSAALGMAYVAAGRWDIFVHSNMQPWDVAAGLLLVREAGGVVSDRDGGPANIYSEGVAAATPGVHADFVRLAGGLPWRA